MRFVGSFSLAGAAMNPGIKLCCRTGVLYLALMCILGCGSMATARSSTLSVIADPAAPHHQDYVEYQQGRLTQEQLMDRLPHVAIIGDSLSRNFYLSSVISSVWRSKMNHRHDWFLDTDASPDSVNSLYERLSQETPLVACEYSSVAARVDGGGAGKRFLKAWRPLSFSQQTDLLLQEKRSPDLVLIWIGHNNLHWERYVDPHRPEEVDAALQKMAANFCRDYERQLDRLVERARDQKTRRAIVVFGLVNFKSFFKARDAAEQLRKENPKLYPYLEACYKHYASMKPEYRANMVKLALMINADLRAMVAEINKKLGPDSQVRLEYSDALANVDLSNVDVITRIDAWHPSAKGHTALAGAAFGALGPSLNFLGIAPLQKNVEVKQNPNN
jgi:lysophospholipase L1-like esterase